MSVATELVPDVFIPDRARTHRPERLASVTTLHRPNERTIAAPVRLTRRGVVVLALAVAVLAVALVGAAWLSAPNGTGRSASTTVAGTVTVQSGDTLWSIASSVAPNVDPGAEVAVLRRLNHLDGVTLQPGQVLRTR